MKELNSRFNRKDLCVSGDEYFRHALDEVVADMVNEERRNKRAMLISAKLPFPCNCGALCSYSLYLRPIITAFDKLYEEYVELHRDFTKLFNASWTRPLVIAEHGGDMVTKHGSTSRILYSHQLPPPQGSWLPTIIDPNRIRVAPPEICRLGSDDDSPDFCQKYKEEVENFQLMVLKKRLAMELERPSILTRFLAYIFAYKDCFCLNCDYRDCIEEYQRSISKLKSEYEVLYRKYEVLFEVVDMLPPEGNKKVIMLSRAQYAKEGEKQNKEMPDKL